MTFNSLLPLVALVFTASFVEAKYEIIVDRVENILGSEDKAVVFETLRVKKFNRTT